MSRITEWCFVYLSRTANQRNRIFFPPTFLYCVTPKLRGWLSLFFVECKVRTTNLSTSRIQASSNLTNRYPRGTLRYHRDKLRAATTNFTVPLDTISLETCDNSGNYESISLRNTKNKKIKNTGYISSTRLVNVTKNVNELPRLCLYYNIVLL